MKSWFKLTALATDHLAIDIFDEIGFWGVTAKDFVAALRSAGTPKTITLNIDSPGGDCNDGFTIYDAIKACGAEVTVNITGLAASMASVIMLAGKTIRIAENGRVMIHRVTAGAHGNTDDLDAAAKVAKQFEDRIVSLYIQRTGHTEEQIRDWMKAQQGTWFFGQQAVDDGFADGILTGTKAKAFQPRWASKFTMLPAALFDISAPPTPSAPIPSPTNMKATIALAALLGLTLKGDETEDQIVTACQAFKPTPPKLELNLEDPETKAHFEKLVDAASAPLKKQITDLEALVKNGAAGAAGAGAPIPGAGGGGTKTKDEQITALQADLAACKDSKERGQIIAQISTLRTAK